MATLHSQPTDLLGLIAEYSTEKELGFLRTTSTRLRYQVDVYRLRLQQLQWRFVLQSPDGSFPSNLYSNEDKLASLGVRTFQFSGPERRAWIAACASLHSPPPPLEKEEREALLRQYAPLYCQLTGRTPITSWNPADISLNRLCQQYLDRFCGDTRGTDTEKQTLAILQKMSLLSVVMMEGSVLNVLEVFVLDREHGGSSFSLAESAIHRLRRQSQPIFGQLRISGNTSIPLFPAEPTAQLKSALLATLILRTAPLLQFNPMSALIASMELLRSPVLVEQLIATGYDFLAARPGGDNRVETDLEQLFWLRHLCSGDRSLFRILDAIPADRLLELLEEGPSQSIVLTSLLCTAATRTVVTAANYSKPGWENFEEDFVSRYPTVESLPQLSLQVPAVYQRSDWSFPKYLAARLAPDEYRCNEKIDPNIRTLLLVHRYLSMAV